ncbi:MAG: type II secretion system protein [Candidatus Omnitrophota bacterium]
MNKKAFTLTELIVVLSILFILVAIIVPSVTNLIQKGRDARRLADMNAVQVALEFYYEANGAYPPSDGQGCAPWDTPGDGDFIQPLKTGGYIPSNIRDPVTNNNCANYRYNRYAAGSGGCAAALGAFYVLGIVDMETSLGTYLDSPGFSCTTNWGLPSGHEWVTGRYEQIF